MIRPRLSDDEYKVILDYRKRNRTESSVLIIGDMHEPFSLEAYLEFCSEQYVKYGCNRVIFIGDIIDNHYSSYHETDADGLGGADELELAIEKIAAWYNAFPNADVIIGNHDRLIMRKAQSSAVPSKWIRDYKEVLGTPQWNFTDRCVVDGVQYIHGEGGKAHIKCRADMMSTVQGHWHTEAYTQWFVGANFRVFGMQVGCGVDHDAYAMAYAKRGRKPAVGCGVVINGDVAINCTMDLGMQLDNKL